VDFLTTLGLEGFLTPERLTSITKAIATFLVGVLVARFASAGVGKLLAARAGAHEVLIVKRLTFYTIAALVVVSALSQLGVNLSVLLGAAGILTVALGFASQTSASNLISGLFLMAERPFVAGDWLVVGDSIGEVLSIDLLSVKIRLFNNTLVRIPNENLIKEQLTNLTPFPIRRVDLNVGVAYKEDIQRVRDVLSDIADRNPNALDEPRPQFFFERFGDSALELRLGVWTRKENFVTLRNELMIAIKEAFDREGIEIPFPHRMLYAGSITEAFPIRTVEALTGQEGESENLENSTSKTTRGNAPST
jgi:small-conductance mechanosensitive channel